MNHQLDPGNYPSVIIDRYQAACAAFIDGETDKAKHSIEAGFNPKAFFGIKNLRSIYPINATFYRQG